MRDLVIKISKNKNIKNGIWLYLLQIFNTIIPMLTLPYITRVLHPSEFGEVSIAINIIGYFQAVVEYGFGMSATRKVALIKQDNANREKEINIIYSGVLFSRILLFIACLVLTVMYIIVGNFTDRRGVCLLILDTTLIGNVLQLNWLFQGKQDMKFISISNIIARVLVVICIFSFVNSPKDIYIYCILTAMSPIIASIIGSIIARKKYRIRIMRLTFKEILIEMKSGWCVFTTQLSSKVFGAIGVTFLGIWASSYEVGIYSAVQKIPYILTMAWVPVSQVLYPISSQKFSASHNDGITFVKRIRKYFLLIFGIGVCAIAVMSRMIVRIAFGEKYLEGAYLILPLLIWVMLGINNNFWGIQILLGSGHDREYSKCFHISVACTVVLNAVFIYFWHSSGAAFAPMCSEAILGLLLYINVKKVDLQCRKG